MGQFGIGQPVRRFEDRRLLTGFGRFQDDVGCPVRRMAMCCARRTRMPASARSTSRRARRRPACWRSIPARIWRAAGLGTMGVPFQRKRPDGSPMFWRGASRPGRRAGALCRRAGRVRRRRDRCAGARRRRADRDRLRTLLPSVTETAHGRRAENPGVGRMPRQHLATCSRPATGQRPSAAFARRRAHRQAPLCHQPGLRAIHGAARRGRRVRSGRGSLHALFRRAVPASRAAARSRRASSTCRRAASASSPAMSAAASG